MMFFERIKELRSKCKKTQQQMADELSISVSSYRKIENDKRKATHKEVVILAKFLQTDEKELLYLWRNDQNIPENIQIQENKMDKGTDFPEPKGVLTRENIKNLGLITNESFDEKCLQSASYDLRLGDEYYVPSRQKQESCSETQNQVLSCPFHKGEIQNDIQKCSNENGVLRITPFSTIVFSTEEILKIPNNVIGRFDLRVRFAMQGLVLQVGTQIEPGYRGRLFGLLLNFSDKEICIPQGMRLLTAEFSYTTSNVNIEDKEFNFLDEFIKRFPPTQGTLEAFFKRIKDIYGRNQEIQNEIISERASTRQYIDGKVRELDEKIREEMTEKRLEKSEKHKNNVTLGLSVGAIFIALLIPVIVMFMSKKIIDKDDYPFNTIIQVQTENEILRNEKDSLELKVLELDKQLNSKNDTLMQKILYLDDQIKKINKNK